jgi:hypothetical protein
VKEKAIQKWSINECGDVIAIETFISCPDALATEEQRELLKLQRLLKRLQYGNDVEHCASDMTSAHDD